MVRDVHHGMLPEIFPRQGELRGPSRRHHMLHCRTSKLIWRDANPYPDRTTTSHGLLLRDATPSRSHAARVLLVLCEADLAKALSDSAKLPCDIDPSKDPSMAGPLSWVSFTLRKLEARRLTLLSCIEDGNACLCVRKRPTMVVLNQRGQSLS